MSVIDQGVVGYMCDNNNNYPYAMTSMRILTGSCTDMQLYLNDGSNRDDAWLIYPGYKVVLYTATGYGGNSKVIDNSTGLSLRMYKLHSNQNKTQSFKAYYKNSVLEANHLNSHYISIDGP